VEGLEPGDTLEWDGVRTRFAVTTAVGDHHARVTRAGRLLWAGWVRLSGEEPSVRLPVPETVPCSTDDVGRGYFDAGRAVPAPDARCDSYVLARAHLGGGIEVAQCERERCGEVVIWKHPRQSAASASAGKKTIWPYAIAATVGALVVTSIVLWRTGAFDQANPPAREVWIFNGQKQMGLGF
jgi:hypothetical protein